MPGALFFYLCLLLRGEQLSVKLFHHSVKGNSHEQRDGKAEKEVIDIGVNKFDSQKRGHSFFTVSALFFKKGNLSVEWVVVE